VSPNVDVLTLGDHIWKSHRVSSEHIRFLFLVYRHLLLREGLAVAST